MQFRTCTQTVPLRQVKVPSLRIPEAAWDHLVNGKAALDGVMEHQPVRTDKTSGIVSDANYWAVETMGNLGPPLELLNSACKPPMWSASICVQPTSLRESLRTAAQPRGLIDFGEMHRVLRGS
ncbi:type ISP restriction/modification enzyme [Pseudomonas aeruginosa]|uniref:type ISP restriction/modification enzyme n=1 Tax=Pseudomonas aeruginosa TaxID=287 RepID=UPI000F820F1C|nr:hypothetical protein DY936_03200 [Pseudomonas aeruginosa]